MSSRIQAIRGMNDVLPAQTALWQHLHDRAREVLVAYGYGEIRLPIVERTELFKRAVGEVTDVVEKEMYDFKDRGGEHLALRPEGTAGCVRAGIEHGLLHNQQQRLWYAGPMFRYERPQAGRYRQFHQIGVEAYGMAGPDIDVEVIALSARLWKRLGFRNLRLELNSLGEADTRARYRAALVEFLQRHLASLDADAQRRVESNPLRVLDSKVPQTQEILREAPSILDYLDDASRAHFEGLREGLDAIGIEHVVNPRLVRGLDYYTHGVFEWVTTELGAQGTVCAGGRYDHLVEQLGGSSTPAVGWASGIERLIMLLQAQDVAAVDTAPQAYFCWLGDAARIEALRQSERLRDALPGMGLLLHAGTSGLKPQLKRANNIGARYALILGDQEVAAGCVQVKSLRGEGDAALVPWNDLVAYLSERLTIAAIPMEKLS